MQLEVDKLRNYSLDQFETEKERKEFYLKQWIPLELAQQSDELLDEDFKKFFKSVCGEPNVNDKYFEKFVEWSEALDLPSMNKQDRLKHVIKMIIEYINKPQ